MRRILRVALALVGVGLTVMFFSFESTYRQDIDFRGRSEVSRTRIGLGFSPWFEWETRVEPNQGKSTEGGVTLLSWSWPMLLVGLGCLRAAWGLRDPKPTEPTP